MSFSRAGQDSPPPEPNDLATSSPRSASLPGDPFPWAPDLSVPEPVPAPADPPAESDPLFPPDLGEGD